MANLPEKITVTHIESLVRETKYFYDGTLTICVITLENGTKLVGVSACVRDKIYNKALGEQYAREDAIEKIWSLEGYLLKQRIFEEDQNGK